MKKKIAPIIVIGIAIIVFFYACDKVKAPYTNKISIDGSSIKRVLCEEGTSTSCTNCPMGICTLEKMIAQYPKNFIPVAFHFNLITNDPMYKTEFAEYNNLFATLGMPCVVIDRKIMNSYPADYASVCSEYATAMSAAISAPPPVDMSITNIQWDKTTRNLSYTVRAVVLANFIGDYRFSGILTEDSVHGTTSVWAQSNSFAHTSQDMCGFEDHNNPVPADSMYYDHVARHIFDGWDGIQGSISATTHHITGDTLTKTYSYINLPAGWNAAQINVIGLIIKHDDGTIVNACQAVHVGK